MGIKVANTQCSIHRGTEVLMRREWCCCSPVETYVEQKRMKTVKWSADGETVGQTEQGRWR